MPEDENVPLIDYQDHGIFSRIANQSMPEQWRLQLEKIGNKEGNPSEVPQYHPSLSRTTSVVVDKNNATFNARNTLGETKTETEKFRPQGRLITTLYEHKHPVNSIAVTDDQSMFFTASKQDGIVHAWTTKDIERDLTSHSRFSIESDRQINQIATL